MVRVSVRFFGLAASMQEKNVRYVELPAGATAGQLLNLAGNGEDMMQKATTILVNKEKAALDTVLAEGDEVIFMVRFAGG